MDEPEVRTDMEKRKNGKVQSGADGVLEQRNGSAGPNGNAVNGQANGGTRTGRFAMPARVVHGPP